MTVAVNNRVETAQMGGVGERYITGRRLNVSSTRVVIRAGGNPIHYQTTRTEKTDYL